MNNFRTVTSTLDAARAIAAPAHAPAPLSQRWSRDAAEYIGLACVVGQLLLAGVVLYEADLITPAFRSVFLLATVGFVVNHLLPMRHRRVAFALSSLGALLLVMGGSAAEFWDGHLAILRTVGIVSGVAVLAGVAILPLGFWWRAAILAGVAAVVALGRSGMVFGGSLALVSSVLASLAMFRAMVFLYETSVMKQRPRLADAAGYFLMLPNSCVGLFPIVDFKTFVRSHYDRAPFEIYQRGVRLIVRGIVQLILYRFIQQLFTIRPEDVASGRDLVQYVLTSAFLYLHVSGQFHLAIGMIVLFGFNLPDTNRRYFLAPSFTEYWRRVNIYWKDFIQTVFHYPMFFRLKRRGSTLALVVATIWSFAVTWVLHLYQTWWLKGSAEVTWPDTLFWLILALLVLGNSLWEVRRGRARQLEPGSLGFRGALGLMVRTAATFACVSLLWSLWSTPTLSAWLSLWRAADLFAVAWAGAALAAVMIATLALEIRPWARSASPSRGPETSTTAMTWSSAREAVTLAVVALACSTTLQARFDHLPLQPLYDALNTGDSMRDDVVGNAGYYERLMSADRANLELWESVMRAPIPPTYEGRDPIRPVDDFRFREFIPNTHVQAYFTDFSTNRWGMRDREYSLAKPPATVRLAVLGASHAMGWGVQADQVFEAILEKHMNVYGPTAGAARVEILNFAQNGLSPLGEIPMLEKRVAGFQPDVVLLVAHRIDYEWVSRDLPRALQNHVPISEPFLNQVLRDARIGRTTHQVIARRRLKPMESSVLGWSYTRIVEEIRQMGAVPVIVFLPIPDDLPLDPSLVASQLSLIASTGAVSIDLTHLYDGLNPADLMIEDHHSNARAHALIADALYARLAADPQVGLFSLINRARQAGERSQSLSPAPHSTH